MGTVSICTKVGDNYILFFYTYDDFGEPEWLLGVAPIDDGAIAGDLQRYTYDHETRSQVLDPGFEGRFVLDYRADAVEAACNDDTDRSGASQLASFYWRTDRDSAVWCTQFLYGGDGQPYDGGVWYAGNDDAGYGFSMSQQGTRRIAIVYYYDADGQPRWALGGSENGGSIELDSFYGYCRRCVATERLIETAGTLDLDWDNAGASLMLSYPQAPFGDFDRDFVLHRLSDGEPTADITPGDITAQAFYDTFISDFVVQDRCINCHVEGGRSGHTRLVFKQPDEPDYRALNLAQIEALVDTEGADYPLNKIQGAAGHGGGIQVPADSQEFADVALLFQVMGADTTTTPQGELFSNVGLLSWERTLRRAALILAGRLPTNKELKVARGEDESAFREVIRGLMKGENFHHFLIESANDRLLTDKWLRHDFVNASFEPYYPAYNAMHIEANQLIDSLPEEERWIAYQKTIQLMQRASAREPLELIAWIVERDRPYTEVVTARYTVVNPFLAEAYQSDTSFSNPADHNEWRKGWNDGQILVDDSLVREDTPNFSRYISGGIPIQMPHAGVLNTLAFLARYPSTATNRNRARARWTYYYFLGVDIEKLADRTRDPDSLADTNNPTMNNPDCAVCHRVHDPVAGAFQNYGDIGFYRDQWGGMDSLPDTYKHDFDSPYREGDTWYRDMRTPGFGDLTAPDAENSLQWLGRPHCRRSALRLGHREILVAGPVRAFAVGGARRGL